MRSTAALLALALASSLGCAEWGASPRTPVDGTAPVGPPEAREQGWQQVLGQIADATCDREQSCGTIGPGATFKTRQDCLDAARAKTAGSVSAGMCPGGVDRAGFDRCLSSLEAGQCAQPGDAITRSAHCEAEDLCIR